MRPLRLEEVVDREHYERVRADYRSAVIAHKRSRRLGVGDNVTLVFEDRETLRFQVQEMLWIERISDPEQIQQELDVYNELMPGERELSATLFIEITEVADIKPELQRLIGIDEHVALVLGEGGDEVAIRARFDPRQAEEDRLSAVQYIRFGLDPESALRLADPANPARLRIDHPNYRREVALPPELRAGLASDLSGEPAPLLPAARSAAPPAERVIFSGERVRAVRPARARAPGHVVVEPLEPVASLLEADAELLAALQEAVVRVAREVMRQHGACRVVTELGPDVEGLRWHVSAPGA